MTRGDWRMTVSPYGASLRGLEGRPPGGDWVPIVTGYHGAANKQGGQGDVLIPFPSRIAGGKYTFGNVEHQLEKNDKDGPNAIHGFLRKKIWDAADGSDFATFRTSIAPDEFTGYPFALAVELTYSLNEHGLTTRFAITNPGDTPAPVGAGFHPYFTVGTGLIDLDWLQVPMNHILEFKNLIPTGRVLPVDGTPYDHRECHSIGATVFNTCYTGALRGADGLLRVTLTEATNRHGVTVWMDKAFDYVVVYTGETLPENLRRRSLAIEPMTCATDAFNHPEWGLVSLAPGETFSGAWGVTTRWE